MMFTTQRVLPGRIHFCGGEIWIHKGLHSIKEN